MKNLEFKIIVLESLQQALKEISAASKTADLASIDAQIKALQLKITAAQKQIADLNKQKASKTAERITTENISQEEFPKIKNKLKGGKGDKLTAKDVDPKQLKMGIKIELEHTNDKSVAEEIALDHLSENPKYYSDLSRLEAKENIGENKMKLKDFYFDIIKEESTKDEKVPEIKYDFEDIDLVNYFQLQRGIRAEVNKNKQIDLEKAKEIALQNLLKNPVYYTDLDDGETRNKLSRGDKNNSYFEKIDDESKDFSEKDIEEQQVEKIEDMNTKYIPFKKDESKPKVKQLKEEIKKIVKEIFEWPYYELSKINFELYDEDGCRLDYPHRKFETLEDAENFLSRNDIRGNVKGWTTKYPKNKSIKKECSLTEGIDDLLSFDEFKTRMQNHLKKRNPMRPLPSDIVLNGYYTDYKQYPKLFKYLFYESIKEARLGPEDADYEVKGKQNEKIYAFLKKKKAEIFTKLIKSLLAAEKAKKDLDEQKKVLTALQNEKKAEHEEQDDKLRQMVLDLFDAEETVNTLYVEANGALLTLAKKTDRNVDSIEHTENTDYKKAWEALQEIISAKDIGLVDQMNDLVKQFTTVTDVEKKGIKRSLHPDVKPAGVLESVLKEFKIADIWNNFKSYIKKFKTWTKTMSKKISSAKQLIDKL